MVKSKASATAQAASGHKESQLRIILAANPAHDDIHTWIREVGDIKTYPQAVREDADEYGSEGFSYTTDWTWDNAVYAIALGRMTVYSSYPIEQGTWVTPSRREAQSYAGKGKVYSMEVRLEQVAWVDGLQGMFADVDRRR